MSKWQRHIYLNPQIDQCRNGEITQMELAASVASKLRELAPFGNGYVDEERDRLIEEFEALAEDDEADAHDFDRVLDALYDWGDMSLDSKWNGKRVCWVDTISLTPPSENHNERSS